MSVNLRPFVSSRASTRGGDASTRGWKSIPQINQLRPQGADKSYVNGAYNCAPAVVAMLARGAGKLNNLSDAQLINQLGKDIVTQKGADPEGVARMLSRIDMPPAGEALGANYKDAELKQHLNQGHMVIAQVRTTDPRAGKDSAHYVLIQGMTQSGNYIVSDPLKDKPYSVTPKQLQEAVLKAPPDGGMLIPVSSPAEAKAAAAKTSADGKGADASSATAAPRTPTQAGMPIIGPTLAKPPTLMDLPAVAPRNPTRTEMPVIGPTLAKPPTLTDLTPVGTAVPRTPTQTAMPVISPTLAATPTATQPLAVTDLGGGSASSVATAPDLQDPDPDAFTATDDDLAGVDTEFKQPETEETNAVMEANEQRNRFQIDVRYGDRDGKDVEGPVSNVTSEQEDEDTAAQELRRRKSDGDLGAYETLEKLEKSTSEKDHRVLEKVKDADKKDPGIGKKTTGDGF